MKIQLELSGEELDGAEYAVGCLADNEHDKGADEGIATDFIAAVLTTLDEAIPGPITFDVTEIAIIVTACGSFADKVVDGEPRSNEASRLYNRLIALECTIHD